MEFVNIKVEYPLDSIELAIDMYSNHPLYVHYAQRRAELKEIEDIIKVGNGDDMLCELRDDLRLELRDLIIDNNELEHMIVLLEYFKAKRSAIVN